MDLHQILLSSEITWETAMVRILISFVIGTLVGIEREAHNQPAGLRTHILISLGATLVMLISIYIPQTFTNFQNGDPGRIAAQVVSGIGFLGAGAILKFGADVKGLTTAASIWAMAALGMAVGAGMYSISFITVFVILFALTIMDVFEKRWFKDRLLKKITIAVKKKHSEIEPLKKSLHELKIKISSVGFERNTQDSVDKITFWVSMDRKTEVQRLVDIFENTEGIVSFLIE